MNYLQRKKLALMMNRKFKGYLRTVSGVPLTLTDCMGSELVSLSVVGNADGVGERTANLFDVNGDINRRADDSIIVSNMFINVLVEGDKINIHCSGSAYYGVGQWISVEIGKTYTYSYTLLNIGEAGGVYAQVMYPDTWTAIATATVRQEGENGIASFTAEQDKVMFCFNKTIGSPAYDTGTIIGNIMFVEGEYTAETLPEYEPYGYKIPIKVSGKNLFNYADYTTLTKYNGDDISANWLTIDGDLFYIKYDYYNGGCWLTPTKQWELSSGTYTLSGKCKDNTMKGQPNICFCGVRWSDDTRNAGWGKRNSNDGEWYSFSYTFTITEDKTVKGIYLQNNGATTKSSICFTNIQLEQNTTASDYEPYHEPITTNIYLDEPLGEGQSINYKKDGLPTIPTFKGTTIIMPETSVQPTSMTAEYYARKP